MRNVSDKIVENIESHISYPITFFGGVEEIQQDATVCRYLFTAKLLYMFRASIAPIIRCTQTAVAASGTDHTIWEASVFTFEEACSPDSMICTRGYNYSFTYS